jgi:hypothetical protein
MQSSSNLFRLHSSDPILRRIFVRTKRVDFRSLCTIQMWTNWYFLVNRSHILGGRQCAVGWHVRYFCGRKSVNFKQIPTFATRRQLWWRSKQLIYLGGSPDMYDTMCGQRGSKSEGRYINIYNLIVCRNYSLPSTTCAFRTQVQTATCALYVDLLNSFYEIIFNRMSENLTLRYFVSDEQLLKYGRKITSHPMPRLVTSI